MRRGKKIPPLCRLGPLSPQAPTHRSLSVFSFYLWASFQTQPTPPPPPTRLPCFDISLTGMFVAFRRKNACVLQICGVNLDIDHATELPHRKPSRKREPDQTHSDLRYKSSAPITSTSHSPPQGYLGLRVESFSADSYIFIILVAGRPNLYDSYTPTKRKDDMQRKGTYSSPVPSTSRLCTTPFLALR